MVTAAYRNKKVTPAKQEALALLPRYDRVSKLTPNFSHQRSRG
jgi:hypothetical protein